MLDEIGVPKGSVLQWKAINSRWGGMRMSFTPQARSFLEVYSNCDINVVIRDMESLMEGVGRFYSYWEELRTRPVLLWDVL